MAAPKRIIIATRGSELAINQSKIIYRAIKQLAPQLELAISKVETRGDQSQADGTPITELDTTGVFCKEIEIALLNGQARLAVHSYKDLPTQLPEGLIVAAVTRREDARDCLISSKSQQAGLMELPPGARVGTGSPRRKCQILARRRDLQVVPMRGNVTTRLEKIAAGEMDACVLAYAGLLRLGRQAEAHEVLDFAVMLPAPAQGALALEIREDDPAMAKLCARLHDPETACAVEAERGLLAALGGGCHLPLGAYARLDSSGQLVLDAVLGHPSGEPLLRAKSVGPANDPGAVARAVAVKLRQAGAEQILDDVRAGAV